MATLQYSGTNVNTANESGMTWIKLLYGQASIDNRVVAVARATGVFVKLPAVEARIAISEGRAVLAVPPSDDNTLDMSPNDGITY